MIHREHPNESVDHVTSVLTSKEDEMVIRLPKKKCFCRAHCNAGIPKNPGCLAKEETVNRWQKPDPIRVLNGLRTTGSHGGNL